MEPWQQDMEWLLQRRPHATAAQIEAFVERVAIIMADHPNLTKARALAIDGLDSQDT